MKKLIAILCAVCLLASCAAGTGSTDAPGSTSQADTYTFTDALGRSVTVANPQRVAALSGSFAETWMLAGGNVACVTQDAFTERQLALPESVVNAGSLKTPSAEVLIDAVVDFVLLSAGIDGQLALENTLTAAGIPCAYFAVETFDEYLAMLQICTDITGRTDLYAENGTTLQAQINSAVQSTAGKPAPTVLLLRAYSGGVKAKNSDNMTGKMLQDLGCINIADTDDALLEDLSLEKILAADPDFIFITTMGANEEALATLADTLESSPAWSTLRAVQENRCIVLEQALFHYKPNNRWGESYEKLAAYLYQS